jgi:hypothetical protein
VANRPGLRNHRPSLADARSADLAQPRRYQIAQNARPITPAARTTSPSLTSRTVMVAGDEERTLS